MTLFEAVRNAMCRLHGSSGTEDGDIDRVRGRIRLYGGKPPRRTSAKEIVTSISDLAVRASASTQSQALCDIFVNRGPLGIAHVSM